MLLLIMIQKFLQNVKYLYIWRLCYLVIWSFTTFSLPLHRRKTKELFIKMKTSELIRFLSRNGCELERHGGRHDKWVNRKTGVSEWIPRHAAEVPKGLAEKIMKKLVGE